MKSLIIAAALLVGAPALAETIDLSPAFCGNTKICVSVPNDAGANVDIYAYPVYPGVHVVLDGVQYDSPNGNTNPIANLQLVASDGTSVTLSATWTSYRSCVRSGRGQACYTHWSLVGGTLVR